MKNFLFLFFILLTNFSFGIIQNEDSYSYGEKYRVQVTFPQKPEITEIKALNVATANLNTENNYFSYSRMKIKIQEKAESTTEEFSEFRNSFISNYYDTEIITDTTLYLDTVKYLDFKFKFESDSLEYNYCHVAYIPFRHQVVNITTMSYNLKNIEEDKFWQSLTYFPPKSPKKSKKTTKEYFLDPEDVADYTLLGAIVIGLSLIIFSEIKKRNKKNVGNNKE